MLQFQQEICGKSWKTKAPKSRLRCITAVEETNIPVRNVLPGRQHATTVKGKDITAVSATRRQCLKNRKKVTLTLPTLTQFQKGMRSHGASPSRSKDRALYSRSHQSGGDSNFRRDKSGFRLIIVVVVFLLLLLIITYTYFQIWADICTSDQF